jgi:hypothetical protein
MSTPMPTLDLTPVLAPLVQQAADAATADLRTELALVKADIEANRVAIETQVAGAGTAVVTTVLRDTWTQRAIALAVVGAVIVGAAIVLIAALLGNGTASRYVAAAPTALAGLVLLVARLDGVALPKTLSK